MKELLPQLLQWFEDDVPFALATITETWGSAPRAKGAAMAVSSAGEVLGSVSGGCVEGSIYELAREVLTSGAPMSEVFGVEDDDAFAVGLTCGGTMKVFVELINATTFPEFAAMAVRLEKGEQLSIATVLNGAPSGRRHLVANLDHHIGELSSAELTLAVIGNAKRLLMSGESGTVHLGQNGEEDRADVAVFLSSFAPPPRMFIFGATDFAGAMVKMGRFLGFHVTLCDARATFATPQRFPEADEIVVEWPHKFLKNASVDVRSVICVLTHDAKFDIPLLEAALLTEARYIGAMGSRRTHEDRIARLKAAGLNEDKLNRLSSPIGLDLGGSTPEETAVSIAGEIIAASSGGSARPLRFLSSPIHKAKGDTHRERVITPHTRLRRKATGTAPLE